MWFSQLKNAWSSLQERPFQFKQVFQPKTRQKHPIRRLEILKQFNSGGISHCFHLDFNQIRGQTTAL
jgi:hypothetical protein